MLGRSPNAPPAPAHLQICSKVLEQKNKYLLAFTVGLGLPWLPVLLLHHYRPTDVQQLACPPNLNLNLRPCQPSHRAWRPSSL